MDPIVTRRGLVGAAAAMTMAAAAPPGLQEPAALLGSVSDGRVNLPKLDTDNDLEGRIPNGEIVFG